jgi:hypothetical protein
MENVSYDNILGSANIMGRTYSVNRTKLILIPKSQAADTPCYLSLEAEVDSPCEWTFMIRGLPVRSVETLDDLVGARMHFCEEGIYEDDTVDPEIDELVESSGWYFRTDPERMYYFKEMLVDFEHIQNNQFRLHIQCQVYDIDNEDTIIPAEACFLVNARGLWKNIMQ